MLLGLSSNSLPVVAQEIPFKDMPRVQGARLLVGYPPFIYAVTTGNETLVLQPEIKHPSGWDFLPSLSRDGSTVAGFRWENYKSHGLQLATYSVAERRWTDYPQRALEGAAAISPDGSKVAFLVEGSQIEKGGNVLGFEHVRVLDLKTGQEIPGPEAGPEPVTLSWSPDGKRLVYSNSGIEIWDTDTNKHWKIADGEMPAWSPDGEWIAYFEARPPASGPVWRKCMVIHPDGTDGKVLVRFGHGWFIFGGRLFLEPPVWSPDSRTLLLNEMDNGERWTMHIDMLDITTRKLKRIMRNKVPVYAWADAKASQEAPTVH